MVHCGKDMVQIWGALTSQFSPWCPPWESLNVASLFLQILKIPYFHPLWVSKKIVKNDIC